MKSYSGRITANERPKEARRALSIQPMQWANLPDLHQTPMIDDSDLACLEEIRAVLARQGKLARFAVHLAHRHFDLAPGEILIERPDPDMSQTSFPRSGILP